LRGLVRGEPLPNGIQWARRNRKRKARTVANRVYPRTPQSIAPANRSDALITSYLSKYTEAAKRTTSFIRKGTLPVIAGNPPAEAAQPPGINGIIVMVAINEKHEPRAPRIPNFLFQNPRNKSAPNSHSETPKNQLAPRMPENRVHPRNKRAVADIRNQCLRLVLKPFLVPEKQKYDHHRCPYQVVIKVFSEKTRLSQDII
jgi:hypothetical protein